MMKKQGRWHAAGVALTLALLLVMAIQGAVIVWQGKNRNRIFLAPMMELTRACLEGAAGLDQDAPPARKKCTQPDGSAAALVERTLSDLGARESRDGQIELGYTLNIPLLRLYRRDENGQWQLDRDMVQRVARTIRDTDRDVVVYMFSTHFTAFSPLEDWLYRNAENLLFTREGPLPMDVYYGDAIYPWSFVRTDNEITHYREQAIRALTSEICDTPGLEVSRIRGVTLLGELHHMFPDFERGMGFDQPYLITDYSADSQEGFRQWLSKQYGTIGKLNRAIDGHYGGFDEVMPPSKDVRTEPVSHIFEHIDAWAHGTLPVMGWVHDAGAAPGSSDRVVIYLNGRRVAAARSGLGRQDVAAAHPEFGTADVGWRHDLDFRDLPKGIYVVEAVLERGDGSRIRLSSRRISVMDRTNTTPPETEYEPLEGVRDATADDGVRFHVDSPRDQASFYYNPLVPLWHAWRGQQVMDYLRYMDATFTGTCLQDTPRFTHQLVPYFNPSWDENRFAVDESLHRPQPLLSGISLYGETVYGNSFIHWQMLHGGRAGYGVTEFHPLRALDAQELMHAFQQHRDHGAQFISFFLETQESGRSDEEAPNMFAFDPDNPTFGSDALYAAMRTLMQQTALSPGARQRPGAVVQTPALNPSQP